MNRDREKQILEILLQERRVSVSDLAKRLYASEPSIRRDLIRLESRSLLKRIHGGAILEESNNSVTRIPFVLRELEQSDAKLLMAQKAARLVKEGMIIMLDGSSSAYSLIPFLCGKQDITVITSGVKALIKLGEYRIPAYSTGGHLLPSCLSLVGEDAHHTVARYNADIVFFSCRGLTLDGRLTDFSIEENIVRQKMMARSKQKVLLCDSNKIGKEYMHNLCHISEIDGIVSEAPLPAPLSEKTARIPEKEESGENGTGGPAGC